jgi:hypothetical protein
MKKILMAAICLMMVMSVNAQKVLNESTTPFEESKFYVGASFSGLNLSYSKASDWSFGLSAKAGYLFRDNWMALGVFDYQNYSSGTVTSTNIGAGARYYFDQCGVYAGLLAKYAHTTGNDDFVPEVHVGYAFFLGRHVTLEPEVYFEHSFNDSDYSTFGLRLGFGYYF